METIKKEHSYKICNATVRSSNGSKYTSIGENSVVKVIEDIGEVIDDVELDDPPGGAQVVKGEIVLVIGVGVYKSCRNCNAKVSKYMGECSKCNPKMKINKCND